MCICTCTCTHMYMYTVCIHTTCINKQLKHIVHHLHTCIYYDTNNSSHYCKFDFNFLHKRTHMHIPGLYLRGQGGAFTPFSLEIMLTTIIHVGIVVVVFAPLPPLPHVPVCGMSSYKYFTPPPPPPPPQTLIKILNAALHTFTCNMLRSWVSPVDRAIITSADNENKIWLDYTM